MALPHRPHRDPRDAMATPLVMSSSSRSMAASSSGEPWTFGPLNHLWAETHHQMPAQPITAGTAIGV